MLLCFASKVWANGFLMTKVFSDTLSIDSLVSLNDIALDYKSSGELSKAKSLYPIILNGIDIQLGQESQAYIDVSVNYSRLLNELGDMQISDSLHADIDSILMSSRHQLENESKLLFDYAKAESCLYQGKSAEALIYWSQDRLKPPTSVG